MASQIASAPRLQLAHIADCKENAAGLQLGVNNRGQRSLPYPKVAGVLREKERFQRIASWMRCTAESSNQDQTHSVWEAEIAGGDTDNHCQKQNENK